MKYYQQLRCKFAVPANKLVKRASKDFVGLEQYAQFPMSHENDLHNCATLIILKHLGYNVPESIEQFIESGTGVWLDYFCFDWWRRIAGHPETLDKHDVDRFPWYGVFSRGLFISSLGLGNARKIEDACQRVDSKLVPEYREETFDVGLAGVYLGFAELAAGREIKGVKQRLSEIESRGTDRCKALCKLLRSIASKDLSDITKNITSSTSTLRFGGDLPEAWVAVEESIAFNLASRQHGCEPDLPKEVEALIVRRRSLGLEQIR